MKKLFALGMAAMMALSLAACGSSASSSAAASSAAEGATSEGATAENAGSDKTWVIATDTVFKPLPLARPVRLTA